MVTAAIHFRGAGNEQRELAAVPSSGAYLTGPGGEGRLWRVDAVVFDSGAVKVFGVEVSGPVAAELTAAWATWGDATTSEAAESPLRQQALL